MIETKLTLTSVQVLAAIQELEGEELNYKNLANWARAGIVVPSVKWPRKRGRNNPRVYNLTDLARVRLVMQLRREGLSMSKVRSVLAYLNGGLPEVMKPKTKARLIVDGWRGVIIRRPGRPDVDAPTGQLRLDLAGVMEGNTRAARAAIRKVA